MVVFLLIEKEVKQMNQREGQNVLKEMKECEKDGYIKWYSHGMRELGKQYRMCFRYVSYL